MASTQELGGTKGVLSAECLSNVEYAFPDRQGLDHRDSY
jgi:hypothetical protein